jgi:hypothetical protein
MWPFRSIFGVQENRILETQASAVSPADTSAGFAQLCYAITARHSQKKDWCGVDGYRWAAKNHRLSLIAALGVQCLRIGNVLLS